MTDAAKKPEVAFVIRLVGKGIKPWAVPLRALATVLECVQKLVEQKDEADEDPTLASRDEFDQAGAVLHLLNIKSSSAAYGVAAPDRLGAVTVLTRFGSALVKPRDEDWLDSTLSSVRDISKVARSLGCEIEFRKPGKPRFGDVIARITPTTSADIEESAFVFGHTSVYARIERIGGATKMGCGIRLPRSPRKMIHCEIGSEELVRDLGQYLYQHVSLHGHATWLRHNMTLKSMRIDSYDPPKTGSFETMLRQTHKVGGHAWDHIDDPQDYISKMR